jgi:hypothetical protein
MEAIVSQRKRLNLTYGHIQPFSVFPRVKCGKISGDLLPHFTVCKILDEIR